MTLIYETENFIVETREEPHVTRADGGHLRILPKKEVQDRTQFSPEVAIEFMRLTMIVGEAFKKAMHNLGIELMRINYQDMGNWAFKENKKPFFHLHIYGRAKNAKFQPYCEAVYLPDRSTGFYDKFESFNDGDIREIKKQIEIVSKEEKYSPIKWGLR